MRPVRGEIKMSVENSVEKNDMALSRAEALRELGLSEAADDEAVRSAFRARLKRAHPDVNGGSDRLLRRLLLARDLLTAEVERAPHVPELLSGGAIERRLDITLAQAIHGGDTTADVPALEVSAADEDLVSLVQMKTLRVALPAGLRTRDLLTIPTARDVQIFRIHIEAGDHIRVWGDDIWMTARIDARLFAAGGLAMIDTPHGQHEIEVMRDTPRGSSLCLKGLGLPASGDRLAGDLHVRLEAVIAPARPLREALDAFRQKWVA